MDVVSRGTTLSLFRESVEKKVPSVIISIEIEKVICRPKENASTCHVEAFLRG